MGTKPARAYDSYYLQTDLAGDVIAGAGRFYKISAVGDTLWSRQYAQVGRSVEVRLAAPVPGTTTYLLAGTRSNSLDADLSILLVNQNGTLLRDTLLLRYGGNEYPTGLSTNALGNYLIGGYSDNSPLGHADQFALKLRSWNRLLPTRTAVAGAAPAYHLYPNPAARADRLHLATGAGAAYTGAYELRDPTAGWCRPAPPGRPRAGPCAGCRPASTCCACARPRPGCPPCAYLRLQHLHTAILLVESAES